jgi:WD40 repeat protein
VPVVVQIQWTEAIRLLCFGDTKKAYSHSWTSIMTRSRLRVFVSSPGDVQTAREVAAQIVEKVAHDFARFFAVEPFLWEYEPMLASGHFQDSIDPPSRFDVVALILGSRLGTPLPERTAVREYRGIDGRAPVTGTEWEFEDALAGARERGTPDILVYRSRRDAEVSTWDPERRNAALKQMTALDTFWARHFADKGTFIGAYAGFNTLEELCAKFEHDLRSCVQRRVEKLRPEERTQRVRLWARAPFRGLEAYEFEHAPIFFGREEAIGAALLRLITNAAAARPFLIVLGASGSGKSSLVKAGLLPRLTVPHRVTGLAFLRRVVFRPGDTHADEDLFDALARCLTSGDGSQTGLPELLGSRTTVAELSQHLRESGAHPDMPFAMVLDRLSDLAREHGRMLRYERPRVILEIDQLEEMYTSERIQSGDRQRFVKLVAALVRSELVWVIATMRSDFWHRAVETPELVQLADGHGRLDLLPPSPSELSQMIRGPAEAAAIQFETHAVSGIPLNDAIAQEAAGEPGALPLLSYLLDQLYQKDIQEAGTGTLLSYATCSALGGLKGAIATRADAVMAAQPAEVRQAMRSLLFALVQMSAGQGTTERPVARRAPLADFPVGTPKRRLIDSLLDPSARLVVADSAAGQPPTVRLAHEALINEWDTARRYVAGNAEALRIRRMLEERYLRWQRLSTGRQFTGRGKVRTLLHRIRASFASEHGLLSDVDLTDGKRLLQHYEEDLAPELGAYIVRSVNQDRRRHQRVLRGTIMVGTIVSALAIGATYEARVASVQREATLQAQARSLTQAAAARLKNFEVAVASAIIVEVLANRTRDRRYAADAPSVFEEARAADTQIVAMVGHTDWVDSAVFSPDGRRIATGSLDMTARIWDATSGLPVLMLTGHSDRVERVAFSPDGRYVVTASPDKTARVWDAVTGRPLLVLRGHADRVTSAEFSPDGRRLLTASADRTARIWDASTGQPLLVLAGHTDVVEGAAFSADGHRVVTASNDRTARLWDADAGKLILELAGHTERVYTAVFAPDGRRIVTASVDKTARVWDAADGRSLLVLSGHADRVKSAAFSPDGQRIVTASDDKTARIWGATTGELLAVLSGHRGVVLAAAFSPDGQRVVTGSVDKTARTWDATDGGPVQVLVGHAADVTGAGFSPDDRHIVTASRDKTARIWDAVSGRQVLVVSQQSGRLGGAAFSPDGLRIVAACSDKTARVWDAATGQQLAELAGHSDRVWSAIFSPDGRRIVTASDDKTARVWDSANGKPLLVLRGHSADLGRAAYSPDGRRIVTASADKTARIWDAGNGQQLVALVGHTDDVDSGAFSPDGHRVVTASDDRTARIWDAASGHELIVLSGHTDSVYGAAYSPDGRRIATASADRTARLWNAATGEPLMVLTGHTGAVSGVAFSSNGDRIVTSSEDKTARVWDARAAPLDAQLDWAEAAQFDPLPDSARFRLGLPRPPDVRRWSGDASRCDQAAAAPYDPDRRAPGVPLVEIVAGVALIACVDNAAKGDVGGRSAYQRGRAQVATGDLEGAKRSFERALNLGYRSAAVDLGNLLSQQTAGMLDASRAISLYEWAWRTGVPIAAFELGNLFERGLREARDGTRYALVPDVARAWAWYAKGADAGDPAALARFGALDDQAAFTELDPASRISHALSAFRSYAAAAERARLEDWPDAAWRAWRYRRASIARVLAREGLMERVAADYRSVLDRYARRRTVWQQIVSYSGLR